MFLSKLRNKKEVISWSLYDFANQPFTTIIVTFVYGAFFTSVIASDENTGTLLWTWGIASTAIIVSILSPILGALADKGGFRKFFLILFTWICAIFSILLYFPQSGDVFFALSLFVIANISFELGSVFCNSYLQDLSEDSNIGKISGFAWGLGFVGGLLALFISLSLFELNSVGIRGINILVPRNMVQASGMYNTLMSCEEPSIIIESLNGYRLKENEPTNLSKFTVLLGKSEILKDGKDITIVSYGSTLRLVQKAAVELESMNIDVEIIDVQTLIPFDIEHKIRDSIKKNQ
mgnify:CR=1 FL=1